MWLSQWEDALLLLYSLTVCCILPILSTVREITVCDLWHEGGYDLVRNTSNDLSGIDPPR